MNTLEDTGRRFAPEHATGITPAELRALATYARDLNAREAGAVLGTSYETVRSQLQQVRLKLHCRTTHGAIIRAIRLGLIPLGEEGQL